MKRVGLFSGLLLGALLLSACGLSGGSSGSSSTADGGSTNTDVTGNVTIKVQQAGEQKAILPGFTENIRVSVTNPYLRINSVPLKALATSTIGGAPMTFSLPAAPGYTVEAVTYADDGSLKRLLKYAVVTPVTIPAGQNVDVTLTLTDIVTDITVPASMAASTIVQNSNGQIVPQYNKYPVQVNFSTVLGRKATPLDTTQWAVMGQLAPYAGPIHVAPLTNKVLTAPTVFTNSTFYYQGEFHIKTSLVDPTTENVDSWTFNWPNPAYPFNALPASIPVLVDGGNIVVTP